MKSQRGQALILVLVVLAVGSLMIAPLLSYASTGLRSQRISEDIVSRDYAADAALEDVLRQMLDSIQGGETPEVTYPVEFGGGEWGLATVIEIPFVPPSEWFPVSGAGQFKGVMVEVEPPYLDAQAEDSFFHYIVRLDLAGVNAVENYGFPLPLNVEYVPGSSYVEFGKQTPEKTGLSPFARVFDETDETPSIDDHQVEWNDGAWKDMDLIDDPTISPDLEDPDKWALEWSLDIPDTYAGTLITVCQVFGNPPGGVCYIEPWFEGDFEFVQMEPCAGLGYGFYIITIEVEGITYEIIVSYNSFAEGGGWNIISYRIVE